MVLYNFKTIQVVPTNKDFIDIRVVQDTTADTYSCAQWVGHCADQAVLHAKGEPRKAQSIAVHASYIWIVHEAVVWINST